MNTSSVLKNVLAQVVAKVLTAGVAFITTVILARALGAELFGEYTKITAYLVLFYLVIDFGINAVFLEDSAHVTDVRRAYSNLLGLRLVLGVLVSIFAVSTVLLLSYFHPGFTQVVVTGVIIGMPALFFYSLLTTATAFFQQKQRYFEVALSLSVGSLSSLSVVYLNLVYFPHFGLTGVYWAVAALAIGMGVTAILSIVLATRHIGLLLPHVDLKKWKVLLLRSVPLGLVLLFNVIYFRVDLLILGYYRNSSEIGAYGFAYKFFEFAITLPTFIMNSVYPQLLRQDKTEFPKTIRRLMLLLFSISIAVSGFFWYTAPLLVRVRDDFAASVVLLRILTIFLPVFYVTSPLMWVFVIRHIQHRLVIVYGLALLVNVLANLLFVPQFGVYAAACITGITEIGVLALGYTMLKKGKNK